MKCVISAELFWLIRICDLVFIVKCCIAVDVCDRAHLLFNVFHI